MEFVGLVLTLSLVATPARAQWVQTAKIDTFGSTHSFGGNVAIEGDSLVASAANHEGGYGSSHLFEPDPPQTTSWALNASFPKSTAGNYPPGDVGVSGDTAVAVYSKYAHVFERDQGGPGAWGLSAIAQASPPPLATGGNMVSISIDGDRIAAGDGHENVFLFERDQGGPNQWGEAARITVPHVGNEFGTDVELHGDLLVVGAPDMGSPGFPPVIVPGLAYVYRRQASTGAWLLEARLVPTPSGSPSIDFGRAVGVSGNVVAVGAPNYSSGERGLVHVYRRGAQWTLQDVLVGGLAFGYSLDLEGKRLVVGTYRPFSADHAYVFEYLPGSGWDDGHELDPTESTIWFGQAVALSGDRIIVSDPLDYDSAIYVFEPSP